MLFTAVGSKPVSSQLCRMCGCAVVMVSAGVCFDEKGRLHFIPDKAKGNAKPDAKTPRIAGTCSRLQNLFFHLTTTFSSLTHCSNMKIAISVEKIIMCFRFVARSLSYK